MAAEARERWTRDQARLAVYGHGPNVLARGDHDLAIKLEEALPDTDGELDAGIGALAELLASVAATLPADAEAAARLAEVPALRTALAATLGTVGDAKARRVIDTAAIDLLDGKIYIAIRDLNEAGRRAIRNGDLQGTLSDYRFHRLNHRRRPADDDPEPTTPAEPTTPVEPTTPTAPSPMPA